jgi:starch phosphorylase
MVYKLSKQQIKENILGKLKRHFGKMLSEATSDEIYRACALTLRDSIVDEWMDANMMVTKTGKKSLYYLSAEFLLGRALTNNMINMHLYKECREALAELHFSIDDIEAQERDAGLGNGGLGRLAACFLDSLSTLDLPATGCGIRYEYGLFRQRILDGEQVEVDDNWLEAGNVWEIPRPEEQVEVHFGGEIEERWTEGGLVIEHKDYYSVIAIPYDMPIMGYMSRMPATLRLWSARAKSGLDMHYFNRGDYVRAMQERELAEVISKVLYPDDNHEQGRQLRLKQFYFLTSATMQHIVRRHKENFGDLHTLPNFFTVQINDTHPALAIPELMRILLDEEGMRWEDAYDITGRVFHYTNHTIMVEALERWEETMFKALLPRIHQIIKAINDKFCEQLWKVYLGEWDKISSMAVISYGEIKMANLCIAVCEKVNGVSQLHSEILKMKTFRDFYVVFPEKFLGITNGITHRRWLAKANPGLCDLLISHIGEGFLKDYREFEKMDGLLDNPQFLSDFKQVKLENKIRLKEYLKRAQRIDIDENTIFDIHAKRIHEYKRQFLKVLHILHLYNNIKDNPGSPFQPATFLFAGKASPGYVRAKNIIRLILATADLVNNDPDTKDKLKVVFIENYGVSIAEILLPAADISEQISTAGLEASGTGNMKFMMNGAVTVGTMDGANVEMYDAVGEENIFIFGATVLEIEKMEKYGTYSPGDYYSQNGDIRRALDHLINGTLGHKNDRQFKDLYQSLLFCNDDKSDKYYLLHDFPSYIQTCNKVDAAYRDGGKWTKMAATNTARSGSFSSDRTIQEYNKYIWNIPEIK